MNLIPEWKLVLQKAWSIRLALLAATFSGAEVALPMFVDLIPSNTFAILSAITTAAAVIARVIAQPAMHDE